MLERCYRSSNESRPSYIDCTVCEEWLTFSNFKAWMEKQDWQGKELDKDILVNGNKVYGPDFCAFVDKSVNLFMMDRASSRGLYMIGVSLEKNGRFRSQCHNPFTKKKEHLGYFDCEKLAHNEWKKRKHELACQLADAIINEKVANAIRLRYLQP